MSRFEHYTGEIRDYQINWEDHFDADDDTIVSSSWVKDTADGLLLVAATSNGLLTATVWLSGGTDNKTTKLINTVVTAGGRTLKEPIFVVNRDP